MYDLISNWLITNYIELLGAILGIVYIFFSIRQNILTWPTGLITSALYIIVFLNAKFYADMALQCYYVAISIYGWYFWLKGGNKTKTIEVPVSRLSKKIFWLMIPVTAVVYGIILYILLNYTDSPVPYMDSMTTALSVVATWMLARKIIEHWIIWVFVDAVSAGLYIYKNLWPTTVLFIIYTIMAVAGYYEWKKKLKTE
ncbi:MAG: nicotinamide mononucleotide transporter [Chlorobi bacterium]|nr:nicotinamide mononucleotide transporter [Chlorobiota bacterium]